MVTVCSPLLSVAVPRTVTLGLSVKLTSGGNTMLTAGGKGSVGPDVPLGPLGPLGPVGASGPLTPVGPVTPVVPVGPVLPVGATTSTRVVLTNGDGPKSKHPVKARPKIA